MPNGVELATAYVTIIPSMKGAQAAISGELAGASGAAGQAAGVVAGTKITQGMSGKLKGTMPAAMTGIGVTAGEGMATGMSGKFASVLSKAALPAALATIGVAVGKELYNIGESFDEMYDTIAVGTGATGEALQGLNDVAIEVAQNVPAGLDVVGSTVADLNTRLGLSGDTLQHVSEQFIQAGHMLGQNIDVNKATAAFNAFKIEGDDVAAAMDDLFTVSQSTGISIDELATAVSSNAASMQTLGFSFEETAAMAGMLDKAGINASGTFSKMSKGLVTLAKDGEEPAEAFQRVTGEIQGFIDKGDKAAALNLATELFGTKGATQFVAAVESGALSVDEMTAALENNDNAILNTADSTASFAEKWQIVKNNLMVAIEPLASGVFSIVGDVLAAIVPVVQLVADAFQSFGSSAETDTGIMETLKTTIQSVVDFLGPVVIPIVEHMGEVFGAVFNACATVVQVAMELIQGVISTVMALISGDWSGAWEAIKSTVSNVWDTIKGAIGDKVAAVRDAVVGKLQDMRDKVKEIIDKIKGFFNFKISAPKIPLPHFAISPAGWKLGDLLKGVKPSLSIDWYAKGGVFAEPNIIGVGERGPEAVLPLNPHRLQPFAAAIADQLGNNNSSVVTINGLTVSGRAAELAEELAAELAGYRRMNRSFA